MTPELKETLLVRYFSSLEYSEQFAEHFIQFIDTGLIALEQYDALPIKPVTADNYNSIEKDVYLWHLKVKPNFIRMRQNMQDAISSARNGDFRIISSAAGSFRGLTRNMDGIFETFMDYINPEIKSRYFELWDMADREGSNIYYSFRNFWEPGKILNTRITGPIDEQKLLTYLQPGEQP
ncbi:hypothetical protein [Vibrio cincinnatiensis]|uniref:hypothetical protein n=1 Tax=Vibrio cincinnatiensis TaxID=675 RepID=UPI001EDF0F0D|nr:hypothetical protein [Vibrio cincinnatiensis]MCG3727793.1 hypothetical protein [Vibrio cincinnatiensis]